MGRSNGRSEKCGKVYLNAYMLPCNGVPNNGKRRERSVENAPIINKAQKGKTNKNKQRSAERPTLLMPFVQMNALRKKKKAKTKMDGSVSEKAA